jgi:undecaprenyl-diphosphatase
VSWFEATVLGLVQGLTEFLPISSSAHLRIVAVLAGWDDPGAAFTAVTQIGTELAVIIYFRADIWRILSAWTRSVLGRRDPSSDQAVRLGWFVILGTIPIAVLGLLLQDTIETSLRALPLVALAMIIFAVLLGLADRTARETKTLEDLRTHDALLLGLAQSLALIPGVSRSGGTITAALFAGYRRTDAARYSFLLALPAVMASGGLEATKITTGDVAWGPTLLATAIAFIVGFATIAWLMRFLVTHHFTWFVAYRVAVGTAILLWVALSA